MSQRNTTSDPEVKWVTENSNIVSSPRVSYNLIEEFPEDSLRTYQVFINGKPQNAQHIVRTKEDGSSEIVSQQNMLYKVTPNSRLVKAAAEVADEYGAVPFNEFEGPWFVKAQDNVMTNRKETQVHALFAWNKPVEVKPGDSIQIGFSIHGSIDGFLSTGGGMFTFRHACSNMFFMGYGSRGMTFDTRQTLSYFKKRHTVELAKDQIRYFLSKVNDRGLEIIHALRLLPEKNLSEIQAEKIAAIIPAELAENNLFDWLKVDDKGKKKLVKKNPNSYDVWNDVTDYLSHTEDLSLESMMKKQGVVEKVLIAPLIQSARGA